MALGELCDTSVSRVMRAGAIRLPRRIPEKADEVAVPSDGDACAISPNPAHGSRHLEPRDGPSFGASPS